MKDHLHRKHSGKAEAIQAQNQVQHNMNTAATFQPYGDLQNWSLTNMMSSPPGPSKIGPPPQPQIDPALFEFDFGPVPELPPMDAAESPESSKIRQTIAQLKEEMQKSLSQAQHFQNAIQALEILLPRN